MRIRIRKVGPSEVVPLKVSRIEEHILDELRFVSLSVAQIAARLGVTEDTVENVMRKLAKQLNLRGRCVRWGLVRWWEQNRKFRTGRTA